MSASDSARSDGQRRPNVIWIFGDQHRAMATGYAGDPNLHTPNLDRLAAEGVTCRGAVAGFPLCCPFRGSLISGRYPHHAVPGHERQLDPATPTIAHAFNAAGYHTAYIGKWHLDGFHEREGRAALHIIPPERRGGFAHWEGYENNNSPWDSWIHGGAGQDAYHFRLPGYETDALTERFIDHLRRHTQSQPDQPFFAVLSVQPPHDPYLAPPEWMGRHTPASVQLRPNVPDVPHVVERARRDLAGYYAMIENLDWNLGRIRAALHDLGLTHDTHIIFFSDHGDMHGSHGQFRKTGPWEESMRVPFIIGGGQPFYRYHNGLTDAPINHVDIAPTTLGLCGITPPEGMAGTSYAALRLRDAPPVEYPDSAYLQCVIPTGHGDSIDRPWRGVVTRDGWKYVILAGQPWLMFNLNDDPYEQVNLAHNTRYSAERRRLQNRLAAWINDTGDDFPLPEIH